MVEQAKTIRELEFVIKGYEENLGEPLRAVREDVENEWIAKVESERKLRLEKEAWSEELVRQLEKEKKVRLLVIRVALLLIQMCGRCEYSWRRSEEHLLLS